MFIAQFLVGPSKKLQQIFQIEHSIVRNPKCPEANQLAIYKRGRGLELGATEKQIQVVARAELEPGTAGLRVPHAASVYYAFTTLHDSLKNQKRS